MKPSDEIFLLVKAMTGKEKLFFRKKYLLLIEDADNNYVNLFDEISNQALKGNEYDEAKLKKGKYTGKFIKNLAFHKHFLYNSILNSLSIYNKDSKDIYIIRNIMTQAEILSDKLLQEQSLKLLQKVKKTSIEKDLFNSLYEIINTERIILRYTTSVEEYSSSVSDLFDEQYKIIEIQKNSIDYYNLNENVGIFLRSYGSGKVREKEKLIEFEKLFENPLLKNIENAKTFLTKYIFYNLNLQYHLTKENYEDAYTNAKKAVELIESNLDKLQGRLDNYVFAINNLLNCEIRTRRYAEFDISASKLQNVPIKFQKTISNSNRVFIFYSLAVLRISKNMEIFDIGKLRELDNEIKENLIIYEEDITIYQRIILYFFLSSSNFMQSNFEKCIYWNSKVFNLGKTDLSEDYQCYIRIIQLISYFELSYIDSLEYALKSAYHFISTKNKVYEYENIIQKYLRRSFRIKTDSELHEMFQEMKDEIENLLDDPFEKNALDAFNILYWLESKIGRIPLIEVIRRQCEMSNPREKGSSG